MIPCMLRIFTMCTADFSSETMVGRGREEESILQMSKKNPGVVVHACDPTDAQREWKFEASLRCIVSSRLA